MRRGNTASPLHTGGPDPGKGRFIPLPEGGLVWHDTPPAGPAWGWTQGRVNTLQVARLFHRPLFTLRQIHSDRIHLCDPRRVLAPPGDGLILNRPGLALIQTADCVPLVLWHPPSRIGAVIHAGWRGLALGIVERAVERLEALGAPASALQAHLGPAICPRCYPVGPELLRAFPPFLKNSIFTPTNTPDGKFFLDVPKGVRLSLLTGGIPEAQISAPGPCTHETGTLPSHRRAPLRRRIMTVLLV